MREGLARVNACLPERQDSWKLIRPMPSQSRLDPIQMLDHVAAEMPKWAEFVANNAREARAWQKRTRKRLAAVVGFLDQKRAPLDPHVVRTVDRGSYVRRKVILRTTPWSDLPLYVLEPKGEGRKPVVLALHGHGYGVKDIVGLWEDGSERWEPEGYHKDFGCELAKRGFIVAAPEISCFGERTTNYDHLKQQLRPTTCHNAGTYAMMLGKSIAGLRVWEGMRALDYLAESNKHADMDRIGAMGISGGGLHTFFSTALDLRIKACVISGYFCDWRHSVLAMNHCTCNFIPGLMQLGELADLAGLIAPRPTLVENGTRDDIFPIQHVKKTVSKARRAWDAFAAGEKLQTDYFEGRHAIGGAKAYDFLGKYLAADERR
jgi:dienelactone hydrolase